MIVYKTTTIKNIIMTIDSPTFLLLSTFYFLLSITRTRTKPHPKGGFKKVVRLSFDTPLTPPFSVLRLAHGNRTQLHHFPATPPKARIESGVGKRPCEAQ